MIRPIYILAIVNVIYKKICFSTYQTTMMHLEGLCKLSYLSVLKKIRLKNGNFLQSFIQSSCWYIHHTAQCLKNGWLKKNLTPTYTNFSQSSIFHAPMGLGGDWWTPFYSLPFSSFQIHKSYFFQIRIYLGTCTYLGVIFLAERRISFIIYETIHSPVLFRKKSTSILFVPTKLYRN